MGGMPWTDVSGGLGDRHHTWALWKAGARGALLRGHAFSDFSCS